jgi:GNAT superfamily N-acetyltransferase
MFIIGKMNLSLEPLSNTASVSLVPREVIDDESIDVPDAMLGHFGWTKLLASTSIEDSDVRTLLQGIALESCAHSWRKCNPLWDMAHLRAWENEHRPTEIIGYFGVLPSGRREIVAMGTVAHAINRNFPYVGFPVLARAYIRPEYREYGLYARLLEHRLSFCRRYWGSALSAIHLGSREPKVWHVIGRERPGAPPFVHIGNEALLIRGQSHMVRAFLMFTPRFGQALLAATGAAETAVPEPVLDLRNAMTRMLQAEPGGHHYERISDALSRVCARTDWFAEQDAGPVSRLLTLCQAIPLAQSSR